jgi:3-polyprenyl-4-hydroxybenzoate decarboxylase
LILTDTFQDLKNFPKLLEHVLERFRPETDLFVISNVSMDTLDYTSGKVNEGSKAIMLGLGEPVRSLPSEFRGQLPHWIARAEVFCRGCLVLEGANYETDDSLAGRIAQEQLFADWPLIILHDDARVAKSAPDFLWSTWTRFEPASDIYSPQIDIARHHLVYRAPIVIDARTKPGFPDELIVREDIAKRVDQRWSEYFPKGLNVG